MEPYIYIYIYIVHPPRGLENVVQDVSGGAAGASLVRKLQDFRYKAERWKVQRGGSLKFQAT